MRDLESTYFDTVRKANEIFLGSEAQVSLLFWGGGVGGGKTGTFVLFYFVVVVVVVV